MQSSKVSLRPTGLGSAKPSIVPLSIYTVDFLLLTQLRESQAAACPEVQRAQILSLSGYNLATMMTRKRLMSDNHLAHIPRSPGIFGHAQSLQMLTVRGSHCADLSDLRPQAVNRLFQEKRHEREKGSEPGR